MEPSESSGLSSYFHHHHHHQQQPPPQNPNPNPNTPNVSPSPTNGILQNNNPNAAAAVYTGSLTSAVSPAAAMESVKRRRGRPRKYSTPEQAAAAKRLSSASAPPKKRDDGLSGAVGVDGGGSGGSSSKKSQLAALGNAGQAFQPHIINVSTGEDVGQKIMMFMQQSKHELCVLTASGSISNASLRQPATSGGSITYEGRFDIITLSGSYVRTETGGRTGGLSVCLASTDGQIIGGGVGGPLIAGGPIQVIVGSFSVDLKTGGVKHDTSPQFGGSPISSVGFRSVVDSSNQNMGGGQFMMQSRGMQPTPLHSTDWRVNAGQGMHQSPENGDYDHLQD